MKTTALCFTLGLYVLAGPAQEINIHWGKENPVSPKDNVYLLGKRGSELFGYKVTKGMVSMVKYGYDDLQAKNEYPLIGPARGGKTLDNKTYSLNSFQLMRSKTYAIVTTYDKKSGRYALFAQEIDNSGKATGSPEKLSEMTSESRRKTGSFDIYNSQDSTRLLLVNHPPFDKYAEEKFGFRVFDENLKDLHHIEVALPYKDKHFGVDDYTLAGDGNIYMLASISLDKKEKSKEEAGHYYEIISVNPATGEVAEYEIKLAGKEITDISYTIDEDYGIICSGFYGNIEVKGRKRGDINGIFFFRVNKQTKIVESVGTKELDKEFIADLAGKKAADKGRGIASTFTLKHFIRKTDGSAIMVAESSYMYVVQTCSTDPKTGARSCTTTYHYVRNNIIVVNISPDGSVKWYANIPKYQHTANDGGRFSSFLLLTAGSRMYFIYNDNPKNMDPAKNKGNEYAYTMNNPYKSNAVVVEIDESGAFAKKMLFSAKENKMAIQPGRATRLSQSEGIVAAYSKGMYFLFIPMAKAKARLARFQVR